MLICVLLGIALGVPLLITIVQSNFTTDQYVLVAGISVVLFGLCVTRKRTLMVCVMVAMLISAWLVSR